MNCEQCGIPMDGRGKTCSTRCRKALSRAKCDSGSVTNNCDGQSVTPIPPVTLIGSETLRETCDLKRVVYSQADIDKVTLRAAFAVGSEVQYHPRTHPERLNWGDHMTRPELEVAGLAANRVPIPGDYDYVGVYNA